MFQLNFEWLITIGYFMSALRRFVQNGTYSPPTGKLFVFFCKTLHIHSTSLYSKHVKRVAVTLLLERGNPVMVSIASGKRG